MRLKDQAILELSQKAQERKATLNQTPDATDEEKTLLIPRLIRHLMMVYNN